MCIYAELWELERASDTVSPAQDTERDA